MRKHKRSILIPRFNSRVKGIFAYVPIQDSEDINLEPTTLVRLMRQVEVEILKPVQFCGAFNVKSYAIGIHSMDIDLAKLLVRLGSASFILPVKSVPAAKASGH